MYQLGWFSTGRDKAARDLLTVVNDSIKRGEISAELAFVFCNRELGEARESDLFIRLVKSYNILSVCFSHQRVKAEFEQLRKYYLERSEGYQIPPSKAVRAMLKHPWRQEYDRRVIAKVEGFHPDLCVLAGYMLIVGPEMCQKLNMINLHPAAPAGPTGTWQEVIWHLIENEAKETGVMMHLVTPELDKGPPVAYCTFPIRGKPFDEHWQAVKRLLPDSPQGKQARDSLFRLIRKHGLAREFPLIVSTIKAFSQGKIVITEDKKVVDARGRPISGYDLTGEINEALK
jgi:folate-dependent phosphoribosylglycinamide formyltransferase PurN